jgi:hypothetical protein
MGIWRGIRRLWSEPGDVLTVLILVLLVGIPLLLAAVPEAVHAPHPSLLPSINARPWLWPAIEPRDKLVYGLFVLAAMLVVVIGRRSGQSNGDRSTPVKVWRIVLACVSVAVIFVHLAAADERLDPTAFFSGFEYLDLAVLGLVLSAWVLRWPGPIGAASVRVALLVVGTLLGLWRMAALIRVEVGVLDAYHVSYVSNELLSVRSGKFPLFDFVAQYTSGLGYVFAGIDWLLPMGTVTNLFVFVTAINFLIVATVVLGIRWAWRSWPATVWPGLLFVSALTFSARGHGSSPYPTIVNYWSMMPIRTTGIAFVVIGIVLLHAKASSWQRELGAGLVVLVAATVNIESASAVLLAFVGYRVAQRGLDRRLAKSVFFFVGPTVVAVMGLAVLQRLLDSICNPGCAIEFIRLFGGMGYYSADMPVIGLHLVLLTGFVLAAAVGARSLGISGNGDDGRLGRIAALSIGASLYGIGAASYYVNRSYANLLISLFPTFALAASGLCTLLRPGHIETRAERIGFVAPMALALLPLTFLLHQATPSTELARLRGDVSESVFPFTTDAEGMDEVVRSVVEIYGITRSELGIASSVFMPLAGRYDIVPALAYNAMDAIVTVEQTERQCESFWRSDLKVVLVHPQGMHEPIEPALACGSFVFDRVFDPAFVAYTRSVMSDGLRAMIEDVTTEGLFAKTGTNGVTLILDQREWTGHGGLYPRLDDRHEEIVLATQIPESSECLDRRRCDSEGRVLEVLVSAETGGGWVVGRFPVVEPASNLADSVVTLEGAWLAGSPERLHACAPAVVAESDNVGLVVRECAGGDIAVAFLEDWLVDGCRSSRNPWLCPIDRALDELATVAVERGFFDSMTGHALVAANVDQWRGKGDHFLGALLTDLDIEVLDGIPLGAESCGVAAWCNADGRRLFLLRVVKRDVGLLLVAAPVAGLGENFDQTVVMVNTSRMFGRSGDLPTCDIGMGAGGGTWDESGWGERACHSVVTPTQVSGFLSWVVDGCEGRSGWWLCP